MENRLSKDESSAKAKKDSNKKARVSFDPPRKSIKLDAFLFSESRKMKQRKRKRWRKKRKPSKDQNHRPWVEFTFFRWNYFFSIPPHDFRTPTKTKSLFFLLLQQRRKKFIELCSSTFSFCFVFRLELNATLLRRKHTSFRMTKILTEQFDQILFLFSSSCKNVQNILFFTRKIVE